MAKCRAAAAGHVPPIALWSKSPGDSLDGNRRPMDGGC